RTAVNHVGPNGRVLADVVGHPRIAAETLQRASDDQRVVEIGEIRRLAGTRAAIGIEYIPGERAAQDASTVSEWRQSGYVRLQLEHVVAVGVRGDRDETGAIPWPVASAADADAPVVRIFGTDHEVAGASGEVRAESSVE